MKSKIKVGIVIADEMEFKPFEDFFQENEGFKQSFLNSDKTVHCVLRRNGKQMELIAVLSGIGKVNAASAAAFLIAGGSDYILNSGLSGGISKVGINDIVIGTSYQMTDFDLTAMGFQAGEIPGMSSEFNCSKVLFDIFSSVIPGAVFGKIASGDIFINNYELKTRQKDFFKATACDMEAAAIALVCHKAGIPFLSFRRISDNAADNADAAYKEMNDKAEADLYKLTMLGLEKMFLKDEIWN